MGTGHNCAGCSLETLGKGFTKVEVGARYDQSRLLVVGEASGEHEARESLPFRPYAQSGSLLSQAMRETHVGRADMAITNIVRCRPPNDWLEGAPWAAVAISQCQREYLYDVIKDLQPRAIIALGGTAYRALTDAPRGRYGTLDYARGFVVPGIGAADGVPVLPSYHPAFIRRGSAHLTPLLQRDLKRAFLVATGKLVEGRDYFLEVPQMAYQTGVTIEEAWEFANQVNPDLPLIFDIETPMSTRSDEDERTSFTDRDIKLFQCTQHRGAGIAIPYREEYIGVVSAILGKVHRRVGFNNFVFDDPVLQANGIDVGETDDVMIMFHVYQPDLPKNLQAVAQYCGFPFPWKHLGEVDLEWYGVADVDATLCAYEHMTGLLKRDGLWEAYQRYFHDVYPILRDMARRGLPIDEERRLALKRILQRDGERVTGEITRLVPDEVLGVKSYKNPPILECECGYKGRGDHICGILNIVPYEKLAEAHGLVLRKVTLTKPEKCRCGKKKRAACDVCMGSGLIPAGASEYRWGAPVEFNPQSPLQVKRYMKYRKHRIPKHAKRVDASGLASETTEVKELERLWKETGDPFYQLLIEKRQLGKMESTYVDGWKPQRDGRIHTTFTFNPATWQTSSRAPNIQNGLKHADPLANPRQYERAQAFAEMQRAEPGHLLVNFDWKSFHAQTTACEAGMADYLRLAKIDIHSFLTCHFLKLSERIGLYERSDEEMRELFGYLKKGQKFKFARDFKSKRTILGIQFGMGPKKMYQLYREDFESESEARTLWELVMVKLFPGLGKWHREVKREAADTGELRSKYGGIRRFYDVQRWDGKPGSQAEEAVAFLPASNAFGHVRDFLLRIRPRGWDERFQFCNTIHDSFLAHPWRDDVDECVDLVKTEMMRPSEVLVYPICPEGLSVEVEVGVGESLGEMSQWKQ